MKLFKRLTVLAVILSLGVISFSCSDSSTGTNPDDDPQEFNSKAAPGDSARSFLSNNQYTSLEVEIDYMPGHEPTQDGLNSLQTFLEERLNKQSISLTNKTQIPSGEQSSYTIEDIRSLENKHRDNFTKASGNTLHVYFLMVNGEYSDGQGSGENVLGVAYWNTSVAFLGKRMEDISGEPPVNPSEEKIESTVFRHEFGHNMGLVGNGSPMQTDHKTSGSAHCTTDGCLMEPSVRTTDFFSNFSGSVPSLDDLCIDDLQANGGK
ncbi:peptidase [Fodinibius halophilus]|uniref:Peptidase n=1 Tax=Fodinibius halophilus TaxID=1736908 RepID=A0A6M1STS3_9BACT|nr:peptidase [Fodinibius halophilus]NGP87338.1 peptidase [Fodinibius halophilus]